MKAYRILSVILIMATVLILSSCSKQKKTQLVVGSPAHNGLYNDLYAATEYDQDVCNLVYESLTVKSDNGHYVPNDRLVEKMTISPDGKTYTFDLKEGITFSDKTPLTADDVVFTYQSLADPSSTAYLHSTIDRFQGGTAYMNGATKEFTAVEAVGDYQVVFRFVEERRSNIDLCGRGILNREYYPDWAQGNVDLIMQEKMFAPMGSGPYVLTGGVSGESVTLTLNPVYWAKEETDYAIDEIQIKFVSSNDIVESLKAGNVDMIAQVSNRDILRELNLWQASLGEVATLNFKDFPKNSYGFLGFNNEKGSASSVAMRQAVAYGFNREGFVENFIGDGGVRVNASVPHASDLYTLISGEINTYEYDVEKAKEILTEGGYTYNKEDQLTLKGEPVVLKFLVTVDNPTLAKMFPEFKRDMAVLGIDIEVMEYTFSEIREILRTVEPEVVEEEEGTAETATEEEVLPLEEVPEPIQWDIFFMEDGWPSDDPDEWGVYFSTQSIPLTNLTRYSDEEVDGWLMEASKVHDVYATDSLELYTKIFLRLNNDLPELPVFTTNAVSLQNKKIKGLDYGTYQRWSEVLNGVKIEEEPKVDEKSK